MKIYFGFWIDFLTRNFFLSSQFYWSRIGSVKIICKYYWNKINNWGKTLWMNSIICHSWIYENKISDFKLLIYSIFSSNDCSVYITIFYSVLKCDFKAVREWPTTSFNIIFNFISVKNSAYIKLISMIPIVKEQGKPQLTGTRR